MHFGWPYKVNASLGRGFPYSGFQDGWIDLLLSRIRCLQADWMIEIGQISWRSAILVLHFVLQIELVPGS